MRSYTARCHHSRGVSCVHTIFLLVLFVVLSLLRSTFGFTYNNHIISRYQSFSKTSNLQQQQQQQNIATITIFSDTKLYEERPGTARFTGTDVSTMNNPLDTALSVIVSDITSIALGLIGLCIVVGHRLSLLDSTSAETLTQETRADLLAIFACGSVLLNGITKLDVTSALSESVVLQGIVLLEPELLTDSINDNNNNSNINQNDIRWAMQSILNATPAETAILMQRDIDADTWQIIGRAGIVPSKEINNKQLESLNTPILDRFCQSTNKESYLPTLQALPGKVEFTYLPSNTQEALLIPVVDTSIVLVLGSNTAKSLTPRTVAWCRVLADRMGQMF